MARDAAPRSGIQESLQIRLPSVLVERIDELIMDGKFSSRSDFIKQLVIRELASNDAYLIEKLQNPNVRSVIADICKETFAGVFKH